MQTSNVDLDTSTPTNFSTTRSVIAVPILAKCGLIGPSNRSGSQLKIGVTLFALSRAWVAQGADELPHRNQSRVCGFVDNLPSANRGACRGKRRAFPTAHPFAHKIHRPPLLKIFSNSEHTRGVERVHGAVSRLASQSTHPDSPLSIDKTLSKYVG